jgi:hypothetical protein
VPLPQAEVARAFECQNGPRFNTASGNGKTDGTYCAQQSRSALDELDEYAAGRNPKVHTEADATLAHPRRSRGRSNDDRAARRK